MKQPTMSVLLMLVLGLAIPVEAQTVSGAVLGPTYYAAAYGVIGDDINDQCSNLNTAMSIVSTAHGGYLDLPYGGLTKLTTCNLLIPGNVVLRCYPTGPGWNMPTATPACGLHITYSGGTDPTAPAVQCLQEGQCGLENMYVQLDTANKPMMLYTCSAPWLDNVRFKGLTSAGGRACADNTGPCPTNKGVLFGRGGSASPSCNDATAGYTGYGGPPHVQGLYFQNTSTWLEFNENANGIIVSSARGDFTDANPTGYAIEGKGSMTSTYGNQFYGIGVEQAPFMPTNTECNYAGVFGLTGTAQGWYGIYESSDTVGSSCVHSAKLSANSQHNHLVATIGQFSGGAFDDASNHMNYLEDLPNQTYSVRQLLPLFLGNGDTFNNRVLNATWAPYIVHDSGGGGGLNHIAPGPYSYQMAWVSDSLDGTCAAGTGGIKVLCFYDGTNWLPMANGSSPTFGSPAIGVATGISLAATTFLSGATYKTAANCIKSGTVANPSVVSCSSASAGIIYCNALASTHTCIVDTTAVTANSEIFITPNAADGAVLSKTCSTTLTFGTAPILAAKAAATSFTINMPNTGA